MHELQHHKPTNWTILCKCILQSLDNSENQPCPDFSSFSAWFHITEGGKFTEQKIWRSIKRLIHWNPPLDYKISVG